MPWRPTPRAGLVAAAALALLAGCFEPALPALACDQSGRCPAGQLCAADGVCRNLAIDASPDPDAIPNDAGVPGFCDDVSTTLCLEFEDDIIDGSARSNVVQAIDGTPLFGSGVAGQGIRFDGTYALYVMGYREAGADETIEFWLSVPPNDQQQNVLETQQLRISVVGGDLEVEIAGMVASVPLDDPGLNHVALRRTGTDTELFVDGKSQSVLQSGASSIDVILGGEATSRYVGTVDQLRIFTRALDDEEIVAASEGKPI